jgi:hypothetical protein
MVLMQNTSHAVMAQRTEPKDSPDDFPTPPWATRALLEHVLEDTRAVAAMSCLEPACGAGHMAKVLKEYFGQVHCSDAYRYGYGHERDFLIYPYEAHAVNWVITNPPFRLAEEFVLRALHVARYGVGSVWPVPNLPRRTRLPLPRGQRLRKFAFLRFLSPRLPLR